jgi:hypothetical protein
MRVYGGCIEPGGMELEDDRWEAPCPRCGANAQHGYLQRLEGGCINAYNTVRCRACGYERGFDWVMP